MISHLTHLLVDFDRVIGWKIFQNTAYIQYWLADNGRKHLDTLDKAMNQAIAACTRSRPFEKNLAIELDESFSRQPLYDSFPSLKHISSCMAIRACIRYKRSFPISLALIRAVWIC